MGGFFNGEHKKKKYALAVLAGILVLPLCSCGGGAGTIQRKAYQYLASRYSGKFRIIHIEREPDVVGPIPVFWSSYHWVLTAVSDRFPNDTFTLRYGKGQEKKWHWSDNYYTLLFRDEPAAIGKGLVKDFFDVDCIIEACVFQDGWSDGIGENSTLQEWMEAGGKILRLTIWFCDLLPDKDACAAFSDILSAKLPNIFSVLFMGLTPDGYQAAAEQQRNIISIWNTHPDWRIGQIRCDCKDRKRVM